jgi:hypothetical protein
MVRFGGWKRALPLFLVIAGLAAGGLLNGCGEAARPVPPEATKRGTLSPPNPAQGAQPVAKNVNLKAPRSIKELQPKTIK